MDEQRDAVGPGHAVADLDGVTDGGYGPVSSQGGGAEDRVREVQADLRARHLLEEDLDRPAQRSRVDLRRREPVKGNHGPVRGSPFDAAEWKKEFPVIGNWNYMFMRLKRQRDGHPERRFGSHDRSESAAIQ
jgi:hypothetical protein